MISVIMLKTLSEITIKHAVSETIQRAKNIMNTVAVSSAEAERGFSVMNTIYSDKRNRLEVKNLANLLVINLIGLPLDLWDCSDSVRMWLRNHNTADDTRVKSIILLNRNMMRTEFQCGNILVNKSFLLNYQNGLILFDPISDLFPFSD